ncbi:hypothetical protein FOPE_05930 [Fonsecaea pedrosoi]|nr:hypothetical protein FOPE_05930 [Fonsecaea pedrosoi]
MASSMAAIEQTAPSYEQRLALSRVLLSLFRLIDQDVVFNTKVRENEGSVMDLDEGDIQQHSDMDLEEGEIPPHTDVDPEEDSQHPEELTMHSVLADALQYLQFRKLGVIRSTNARRYSWDELVTSLKEHLSPTVNIQWYYGVERAVRIVLVQIEKGVWPIEPIARYECSTDTDGTYVDANATSSAEDSTQSDLSSESDDLVGPPETQNFTRPVLTMRPTGVVAAVVTSPRAMSISPVESNCSITPSESASQVASKEHRGREFVNPTMPWSRYDQLGRPVGSNCSIAPSESASQLRWKKYRGEHRVRRYRNPTMTWSRRELPGRPIFNDQ